MGMIPEGLHPKLVKIVIDFLAAFPGSSVASGVRDVAGQAHAMAGNIVKSKRRTWIVETYRNSSPIRKLQHWVDEHPLAVTEVDLAIGLLSVFKAMSADELSLVSCHFTGEAVDFNLEHDESKAEWEHSRILWLRAKAIEVKGKFIEEEGGVRKLHFQLRP